MQPSAALNPSSAPQKISQNDEGLNYERLHDNLQRGAILLNIGKTLSQLPRADFSKLQNRAFFIQKNQVAHICQRYLIFPGNEGCIVLAEKNRVRVGIHVVSFWSQIGEIGRSLTIKSTSGECEEFASIVGKLKKSQQDKCIKIRKRPSSDTTSYFRLSTIKKDIESQKHSLLDLRDEDGKGNFSYICIKNLVEK